MGTFGNNFGNNWSYPFGAVVANTAGGNQQQLIQRPQPFSLSFVNSIMIPTFQMTFNDVKMELMMKRIINISMDLFTTRVGSITVPIIRMVHTGKLSMMGAIDMLNSIKVNQLSKPFENGIFVVTDLSKKFKEKVAKIGKLKDIAKLLDMLDVDE